MPLHINHLFHLNQRQLHISLISINLPGYGLIEKIP